MKIINIPFLIGSISSLFCCVFPILFTSLGLGASFASFLENYPSLYFLIEYSNFIFILSFVLLILGYFLAFKNSSCKASLNCKNKLKVSKIIWSISFIILLISMFIKYILDIIHKLYL